MPSLATFCLRWFIFVFQFFFWISLVLIFFCKNSVKSEALCFFRGKAKINHLCQAVQRGAIHLLLSIVLYRFLDVAMEVRVHPLRLLLLRPKHWHERTDKGPFNYYVRTYGLGWFKNPVSSQTEKLMAGTKFSDYLGLKHYKKAKN